MYSTLDFINLTDNSDHNSDHNSDYNSDHNSDDNSDDETYQNLMYTYCENENCYNFSTKILFGDYYCDKCYPNFKTFNTDIIKLVYKHGIDNTYPSLGNRISFHYKAFIINKTNEYEFYNTYKKGMKEIILGDSTNLKLFNTVITSMNKSEQSIFLTNFSYINYLNHDIKYDNQDEDNKIEKFKFEIEIIDITNPVIFTKKIII